jgi:hypothetical protein
MDPTPFLDRLLDDEGITAGLNEPEAMLLVRELSNRVRAIAAATNDAATAKRDVDLLCRRGRQIANDVAQSNAGENRIELLWRKLGALNDPHV